MACIIPQRIVNPHYKKLSEESGVRLYTFENRDDFYIDVPCGKCYHCLKSYKHQWNFRLQEHYKYLTDEQKNKSLFITLTFRDDTLPPHNKKSIALLVRKFLERVRKHYKRSVTHFLVTEFGETTHRLHLHGILFDCPFPSWKLEKLWSYGFVSYRTLTPQRITYITTYITKLDKDIIQLPQNKQYVFSSPGIGKKYADQAVHVSLSHLNGRPNPFTYFNGRPLPLPRYLRLKLFSEVELDQLKKSYFYFRSDDVIPDGPFRIANHVYNDYTLFLLDASKYRYIYNSLYRKQLNQLNLWHNMMLTTLSLD